ncbi:EAL domain, c-di-GMP-specific phosphodiesterase class I (or its enzymatically inactive variant) [Marinospirillum celere]|uniref:EAL domain, c-di-GMP-specific phosphodiesterase class I (Or its enzymatically inactive variant) n=1 Tax=Marinospirillum celere TaxID=1122252 RepID=A0A1I1EMS7_9GAMM|nr:EAL domain-containing protein [Marinospirillum celere]SFB86220.1 EAL domain, c-di-GMP-specific phosphodiesterase class I (or its enzymatically inactive variant) [Marinospirillum celere]
MSHFELPYHLITGIQGNPQSMRINSHFQPIVSLTHRRVVGYEALLRATYDNNQPCSPVEAFNLAQLENRIQQFDRQCIANHLNNFAQLNSDNQWLFLNLRSETINPNNLRSDLLERFLKRQGLGSERMVLEILEDAVSDPVLLQEFVQHYKDAGFLIAIDDFGTGQSNFDRIWQLEPHIVKLDRSMLVNARNSPRRQRWLSRCVALLRETGALVLLEGVETEEDALLTLDSECDLAQGFYFARPSPEGSYEEKALSQSIQSLHQHTLHAQLQRQHTQARKQGTLQTLLKETAKSLEQDVDFKTATQPLQAHAAIERIYLLDAEGVQIVENLHPGGAPLPTPAYAPLNRGAGALWARRSYFRDALENPGQVQVSAPYLGLPDATLDITLSVAIYVGTSNRLLVLCADLPASWLENY